MLNFCTLFDSNYLTRGLAMYKSLKQHCSAFHLYVFAFDDKTFDILTQLKLENISIISLKDFEDKALLELKPTRSKAEYCWTCTPSTILYVINNFSVDHCTYIDSDLFFYSDPKVLYEEMGSKSVLITEHRFAKVNDRARIAGIYCVQFITFKNDVNGLEVLNWWRNACNDWCYNRYEDGKFGDQKYLDDWTTRFKGVHVLNHLGGGVAPWNIRQYDLIERKESKLFFKTKKENTKFEGIFYHFHYVRFYQKGLVDFGWVPIPKNIVNNIYIPYVKEIEEAFQHVRTIDADFSPILFNFNLKNHESVKEKIKYLIKIISGLNLFSTEKLKNS